MGEGWCETKLKSFPVSPKQFLPDLTCPCICIMYVGGTRRVISRPGPGLRCVAFVGSYLLELELSLGIHVTAFEVAKKDGDLSACLP
jgi:hypothetical protein